MNAAGMENATNILVVEDEAHLAQGLQFNLQAEGFHVRVEGDGESALQAVSEGAPIDAILLDAMLPGKDGFEVLAELRQNQNYVPVLMLTARGRPEDVLKGFAAGADDYLTKPFDLSILIARLNGLLRRMAWHRRPDSGEGKPAGEEISVAQDTPVYTFDGRTIDFDALELTALGKTIRLTLMEADLLRYMVRNEGRIVSRRELLEQVWRVRQDTDTRAIDNFMVRLRRYIEDEPTDPRHLQTVRGVGYRFFREPSQS